MQITPEDHARIAVAVAAAEKNTSGEIRCVLAAGTSDHQPMPMIIAAAASLVLPPLALLAGLDPQAWFGQWSAGHTSAAGSADTALLTVYVAIQAAVFVVVWALASLAPIRRALTPASVLKARVHAAAVAQFEALGLTQTRDRTGVLLFASLDDRRAQVLADSGIYAVAPPLVWDEVVALMIQGLSRDAPVDGFVAAIERTGAILSAHLPPRGDDKNELSDALVRTSAAKSGRRAPKS